MRYTHDCDKCVPLGEYGEHDLYWHPGGDGGQTVIARFGNAGPDYTSGLEAARYLPELSEAKRRAIFQGFLWPKGSTVNGS